MSTITHADPQFQSTPVVSTTGPPAVVSIRMRPQETIAKLVYQMYSILGDNFHPPPIPSDSHDIYLHISPIICERLLNESIPVIHLLDEMKRSGTCQHAIWRALHPIIQPVYDHYYKSASMGLPPPHISSLQQRILSVLASMLSCPLACYYVGLLSTRQFDQNDDDYPLQLAANDGVNIASYALSCIAQFNTKMAPLSSPRPSPSSSSLSMDMDALKSRYCPCTDVGTSSNTCVASDDLDAWIHTISRCPPFAILPPPILPSPTPSSSPLSISSVSTSSSSPIPSSSPSSSGSGLSFSFAFPNPSSSPSSTLFTHSSHPPPPSVATIAAASLPSPTLATLPLSSSTSPSFGYSAVLATVVPPTPGHRDNDNKDASLLPSSPINTTNKLRKKKGIATAPTAAVAVVGGGAVTHASTTPSPITPPKPVATRKVKKPRETKKASNHNDTTPSTPPTSPASLTLLAAAASGTNVNHEKIPPGSACLACHRHKVRCSRSRPCERCVRLGRGDQCADQPPKPSSSSRHRRTSSTPSSPHKTTHSPPSSSNPTSPSKQQQHVQSPALVMTPPSPTTPTYIDSSSAPIAKKRPRVANPTDRTSLPSQSSSSIASMPYMAIPDDGDDDVQIISSDKKEIEQLQQKSTKRHNHRNTDNIGDSKSDGSECHDCHSWYDTSTNQLFSCTSSYKSKQSSSIWYCNNKYCRSCLINHFKESPSDAARTIWRCVSCRGLCACSDARCEKARKNKLKNNSSSSTPTFTPSAPIPVFVPRTGSSSTSPSTPADLPSLEPVPTIISHSPSL